LASEEDPPVRVKHKGPLTLQCTRSGIDGRIEFYDAGGAINFYISLLSPVDRGEAIHMRPTKSEAKAF
jgi:hypothetical protein